MKRADTYVCNCDIHSLDEMVLFVAAFAPPLERLPPKAPNIQANASEMNATRNPPLPVTSLPAIQPHYGMPATGWVWGAIRGPCLSLGVHLLLIVAVAHWWIPLDRPMIRTSLIVPPTEAPVELEQTIPTELDSVEIRTDSSSASAAAPQLDPLATIGMNARLVEHLAVVGVPTPTSEVASLMSGLGGGGGDGDGGQGLGDEGEAKRGDYGTEFFGISASGRRFVFVVDSSRSMSGKRWVQACQELLRTVGSLSSEQSFYVIFFDATAHPMFTNRIQTDLLPATDSNRVKLRRWMSSISFGSETLPATSMRIALQLEPDAIFLLSDGEFHDSTAGLLRATNHVRDEQGNFEALVPVHTIGFHSRAAQASLKPLAEENGGRFRFIPNPRDRHLSRVQR